MELPREFCRGGGGGSKGGGIGSEGCSGTGGFAVRKAAGALGVGRGEADAGGADADGFVGLSIVAGGGGAFEAVRSAGAGVGAAERVVSSCFGG